MRINCYTEVRYSDRISYILSTEMILRPVVIIVLPLSYTTNG